MNNKSLLIIFVFCVFLLNCNSDEGQNTIEEKPEIAFVKTLGGSKNDVAQSVIVTSDGGYAILGHTQSNDFDITDKTDESFDYFLLKFDTNDQLQWTKTYGGSGDDRGNSLIETHDGGFAVLGYSTSNDGDVSENFGMKDYWFAKLDANGTLEWETTLGYAGNDTGTNLIQTQDNGYLLLGILDVTASNGEGNTDRLNHAGGDYWAIKLSENGEVEWSKYYGGTFTDTPYAMTETDDNAFILVGSSDSDDVDIAGNKGSYDFWTVKVSSENGEILWEQSYGGSQIDEARAIAKTPDGNFVITGDTRSNDQDVTNNNGGADLWVIKINPNGDLLWEKTFGGSHFDVGRSVSVAPDGGLLISGNSRSENGDLQGNNGQNDAWVLKLDAQAHLEWQYRLGGNEIDGFLDAKTLPDSSVIAVGESASNGGDVIENKGFKDVLVVKIESQTTN